MVCSFGGKCIPGAKQCFTLFGTDITTGLHGTSCFQDMSQTSQYHSMFLGCFSQAVPLAQTLTTVLCSWHIVIGRLSTRISGNL